MLDIDSQLSITGLLKKIIINQSLKSSPSHRSSVIPFDFILFVVMSLLMSFYPTNNLCSQAASVRKIMVKISIPLLSLLNQIHFPQLICLLPDKNIPNEFIKKMQDQHLLCDLNSVMIL